MRNLFLGIILGTQILAASAALPAASAPATDETEALRAILAAPAPDPTENSKAALSKIYLARGRAAGTLGDTERELKELTAGIEVVGAKDPNSYELHDRLARLEFDRGDFIAGRAARQAALSVAGTLARRFFQLVNLASTSAVLRDRESAKAYLSQAEGAHSSMRRGNPDWNRFGDLWNAALSDAKGNYNLSFGYILEAESDYRTCATAIRA